jgi:hypothetical protein
MPLYWKLKGHKKIGECYMPFDLTKKQMKDIEERNGWKPVRVQTKEDFRKEYKYNVIIDGFVIETHTRPSLLLKRDIDRIHDDVSGRLDVKKEHITIRLMNAK